MALGLTRRQSQTLRFIAGYLEAHGGIAPNYDEMQAATGAGRQGVADRLNALEERGHIRRLRYRERAIELLEPVAIPRAPDGAPLYYIPVPSPLPSCTGSRRNTAHTDVPAAPIHAEGL